MSLRKALRQGRIEEEFVIGYLRSEFETTLEKALSDDRRMSFIQFLQSSFLCLFVWGVIAGSFALLLGAPPAALMIIWGFTVGCVVASAPCSYYIRWIDKKSRSVSRQFMRDQSWLRFHLGLPGETLTEGLVMATGESLLKQRAREIVDLERHMDNLTSDRDRRASSAQTWKDFRQKIGEEYGQLSKFVTLQPLGHYFPKKAE